MKSLSTPIIRNNSTEEHPAPALAAAGIGVWELDTKRNEFRLSSIARDLLGATEDIVPYHTAVSLADPRDQSRILKCFAEVLGPKADNELEIDFRQHPTPDGTPRWRQFRGRAERHEDGTIIRFTGIIQDVSRHLNRFHEQEKMGSFNLSAEEASGLSVQEQLARARGLERRLQYLIEEAPVATAMYLGRSLKIEFVNDVMVGYWRKDRSVLGKTLREAVPELVGQSFFDMLDEVYTSGKTYESQATPATLLTNGRPELFYFDFVFKPMFDHENNVFGIFHMAVDVTQEVQALKASQASETNLASVIAAFPTAVGLLRSPDLIVEMPNEAFIKIVGRGPDIAGKPLRTLLPEPEHQHLIGRLDKVFETGKTNRTYANPVPHDNTGGADQHYYDITNTPLRDAAGQVSAVLSIAVDVTEKVLEQQKMEESQLELLALFEQSPVAIAILDAASLTFKMVNPFYAALVGRKKEDILGKKLLEAIPELADQGIEELLRKVAQKGVPYARNEMPVHLVHDDHPFTIYVDATYQPRRNAANQVTGIMIVATDVTEQVLARQKIEEAESTLRGAVDLAELGTWQFDLETHKLDFSPRLRRWFGLDPAAAITFEEVYENVRRKDRDEFRRAIETCLSVHSEHVFKIEFCLDEEKTGTRRILTAQGRTYFDSDGHAYKLSGTMQDVTQHRSLLSSLEQLVEQRTEELAASNEELAATNEKLVIINEELEQNVAQIEGINEELVQTNKRLVNSNNSLQQFSYVASHDLQEPLRKIQTFGTLLAGKVGTNMSDEASGYLSRMQQAASRMSALIEDLLSFSRVSNQEIKRDLVSLKTVMKWVLSDLELFIEETGATIEVGKLPIVTGDQSQLMQLFNNLISNAIKFHKPGIKPVIHIESKITGTLPPNITARRSAPRYHEIHVKDNGIGFDPAHKNRIFQVFQRLHGKSEFPGTGIGLAICEKVVFNHGGVITADSEPGRGSVFSIYLPAE